MKFGTIVVHVNTHRLTEFDFWCDVVMARRGPWRHSRRKVLPYSKCIRSSVRRIYSSVHQFLIHRYIRSLASMAGVIFILWVSQGILCSIRYYDNLNTLIFDINRLIHQACFCKLLTGKSIALFQNDLYRYWINFKGLSFQTQSALQSMVGPWTGRCFWDTMPVHTDLPRWQQKALPAAARSSGIFQQVRGIQRSLAATGSSCSTLRRTSVSIQPCSHSSPWINISLWLNFDTLRYSLIVLVQPPCTLRIHVRWTKESRT